jgi:hypothetical protein
MTAASSLVVATREGANSPVIPAGKTSPLPRVQIVLPRVPIDPEDMSDLMRAELERHRRELPALVAALPALAISVALLAGAIASLLNGVPA